jgi:pyrroloquinoline-quinone synthase
VSGMLANYDFVTRETLAYFTARPVQAQRDSDFAIEWVKDHALTAEQQQAALRALEFKCDVLWAQSDALMHAYVEGHPPPGAWRGEGA